MPVMGIAFIVTGIFISFISYDFHRKDAKDAKTCFPAMVMKYADIIDKSRKIKEMIGVGNFLNPPLCENLKFSIL
jgi:hypothetical protein